MPAPPATIGGDLEGHLLCTSTSLGAGWALGDMASEVLPGSSPAMTWKAGGGESGGGYTMWLDRSIPTHLGGLFARSGLDLLGRVGLSSPYTTAYALHPGGKAIVNAFENALAAIGAEASGIDTARGVLRDVGNCSSATMFFVLSRLLPHTGKDDVFAAGFGPGLTVEVAALKRV